ncbi:type VI secretion system tube protein Hcp [Bradyrhizobium lablabi]|uniref:Hcp family type VI secretion system effector n=1 Tax=Bradyrhizobium lablabi TaxID=722472 RepID=UPI001BA44020|nr:type VI secretion system tube protein Hcp [Bradyrhizobium lablabi]MBR0697283.1 type VI secretion system tube protein Hcp [Bradyrhizobium lablabi]
MPIYMRITRNGQPVIKGDATAKGHEKWIELASAQLGQTRSIANSRVASAPAVSEIVITKSMDSASTALFRQSLYGEGVTIQIDFVKPGGNRPTYLTITLQNALISSYQSGAGPSDGPTESLALNFTKMTFDLPGTGPDVSGHAEVLMRGWDAGLGTP